NNRRGAGHAVTNILAKELLQEEAQPIATKKTRLEAEDRKESSPEVTDSLEDLSARAGLSLNHTPRVSPHGFLLAVTLEEGPHLITVTLVLSFSSTLSLNTRTNSWPVIGSVVARRHNDGHIDVLMSSERLANRKAGAEFSGS
ncbi:hypothetical protein QQF64_006841, partial [Cirrhinus molitorella]